MVTNALSPLRAIETLQDLVTDDGTIGVMTSGQGSIANNERGGYEVYRGSKAALNMFMRSYAARHREEKRALVLMAPGGSAPKWAVRTQRFRLEKLSRRSSTPSRRNAEHPVCASSIASARRFRGRG